MMYAVWRFAEVISLFQETNSLDISCPVRFEEYGYYVVWEPKGKDAGVLDLIQVFCEIPESPVPLAL